jgi:hypothetical protein
VSAALLLAGCSSGGGNHVAPTTATGACGTLAGEASQAPIGALLASVLPVATVRVLYRNVQGLNAFLHAVTSPTVDECAIGSVAHSHCKNGGATFLITPDGRHKFAMPCGQQPGGALSLPTSTNCRLPQSYAQLPKC